jgi:hypothetical protein
MNVPLELIVREMRSLGKQLLPHTFPKVTHAQEESIAALKKREIEVDGYDIIVYFSNADYGDRILETLQIFGKNFTHLPFYLVCKIARAFLSDTNLALIETIDENDSPRKIYIWTLYYDVQGNQIEGPFYKNAVSDSFEGFHFLRIPNKDVIFF